MKKCPYCETELSDSAKFCGNCGASLPAPASDAAADAPRQDAAPAAQNASPASGTYSMPGDADAPSPVKKKSKKKVIIPVVIILLLALLAGAAYAFRGALMQMVLPADKYIQTVAKCDVKSAAKAASKEIACLTADENKKLSPEISLGLKIEDGAVELLDDFFKESGIDGVFPAESLKKFNSADVKLRASAEDNIISVSGLSLLNDKDFLSANVILDSESKKAYYNIPELCEKYCQSDASELFPEENENILEDIKSLVPDDDTLKAIITRYGNIAAESMTDVKKTGETVEAGGISQKLNVYTVTYTDEQLKALETKILDTLKADEDIKEILKKAEKIKSLNAENCYDEFIKAVDNAKEELDAREETEENTVIVFYKDFWGNNAGAVLNTPYDESSVDNEGYVVVRDGEKIGVRAFYGYTMYEYCDVSSIEGSGTYKNGTVSLDLTAEQYEEKTLDISVRDLKLTTDGINGEIKLSINKERTDEISGESEKLNDFLENFAFGIKLDSSIKEKKSDVDYVLYNGKDKLISLNLTSDITEKKENLSETLGSASKEPLDEEEWNEEIENGNVEEILEKKLNDAGITEDDITAIGDFFGMLGSIFNPYDFEEVYDEDDSDDWSYDEWDEYFENEYGDDYDDVENWTDEQWHKYFSDVYGEEEWKELFESFTDKEWEEWKEEWKGYLTDDGDEWFYEDYGEDDMFGYDPFFFGDGGIWGGDGFGGFFGEDTAPNGSYT